jgi:hypothetical protein
MQIILWKNSPQVFNHQVFSHDVALPHVPPFNNVIHEYLSHGRYFLTFAFFVRSVQLCDKIEDDFQLNISHLETVGLRFQSSERTNMAFPGLRRRIG